MKKKIVFLLAFTLGTGIFSAQQFNLTPSGTVKKEYDWKNMTPEQRKKVINNMNPEERIALLKEFRENMMISELNIPEDKQEQFKILYAEYQERQKEIKNKFQHDQNYNSMSDEDAKKQLNQSFEVGQQLLNHRKEYCGKFMKIITAQQVLKMYDTEGVIRNKIMDMKGKEENSPKKRKP